MSAQLAPLPTSLPTGAARAASTRQETTAKGTRGKRPAAGPPKKAADAQPPGHHPRRRPEEHLCTCGRLREECVRGHVRALWS
jgi:hypothetical protein